jgi:hypothetical protein
MPKFYYYSDYRNQPNKSIKLLTKKKFNYYYFEDDKINFNYYDLSDLTVSKLDNYREIEGIYNNIFDCNRIYIDNILFVDEDYNFNKEDFRIFYEIGIMNYDEITIENITKFYNINESLCIFLTYSATEDILQKFNIYLRRFTQDENVILIIKQMLGLEERIFENKIVIDKISNIYENYDFVYICIAPGNHTNSYIPEIFVKDVINNYKTAIIYISELDDSDFHPFWLRKDEDGLYVSESNMIEAFRNTSDLLTNKLDVYIFEYRIPYRNVFFFNRLNSVIIKKTLLYIGFESSGLLEDNDWNQEVLSNILINKNIKIYRGRSDILTSQIFLDFINDPRYKNKYLKYKQKYMNIKNLYK